MVRYYGGRNVGPLRFEIFKMVVKSAMGKLSRAAEELQKQKKENSAPSDTPAQGAADWPDAINWSRPQENWDADSQDSNTSQPLDQPIEDQELRSTPESSDAED